MKKVQLVSQGNRRGEERVVNLKKCRDARTKYCPRQADFVLVGVFQFQGNCCIGTLAVGCFICMLFRNLKIQLENGGYCDILVDGTLSR